MTKPPSYRTLQREDFPGQEEWIDALIKPLNTSFTAIGNALSKGLTVEDNIDAEIFEYEFTYTGASVFPLYLPININHTPRAVYVVYAFDVTNNTTPPAFSDAIFASWDISRQNSKEVIRLGNISGLTSSNRYKLRFKIE